MPTATSAPCSTSLQNVCLPFIAIGDDSSPSSTLMEAGSSNTALRSSLGLGPPSAAHLQCTPKVGRGPAARGLQVTARFAVLSRRFEENYRTYERVLRYPSGQVLCKGRCHALSFLTKYKCVVIFLVSTRFSCDHSMLDLRTPSDNANATPQVQDSTVLCSCRHWLTCAQVRRIRYPVVDDEDADAYSQDPMRSYAEGWDPERWDNLGLDIVEPSGRVVRTDSSMVPGPSKAPDLERSTEKVSP